MKKFPFLLFLLVFSSTTLLSAQPAIGKADSYCTFAGKKGGVISKNEIAAATKIEYVNADSSGKVREFSLSVAGKNIEYKVFYGRNEELTDEMLNCLKQAPVQAKFYFEYIRVGKGEGFGTLQAAPLSFTIVE
jgi:hypothetical protein